MPRCEGRPGGPCPDDRNDRTVRLAQGDLMLCEACEQFRFPQITAVKRTKTGKGKKDTIAVVGLSDAGRATADVAQPVSNTPAASSTSAVAPDYGPRSPPLFINELLSYVAHYRNKSNGENLRRAVLSSYVGADIREAKELLCATFRSSISDNSLLTERRDSSTRPAHEADLDDVIGLFDHLDVQGHLQEALFVAVDLDRLPKYAPEELNVAAVVERQQKLDATVEKLSNDVAFLKQSMDTDPTYSHATPSVFETAMSDIQNRIDTFHAAVNSRIDYLNSICSQLNVHVHGNSTNANTNTINTVTQADDSHDRSYNIVIFGVAENRQITVWKNKIDDILQFVVGRAIEVTDAFRLGKFSSDRARPILVKLHSIWDRRLILKSTWKLKTYPDRVFIGPDESLEVRRKNTLERLKYRAEREGKSVVVIDDRLQIDDVVVFTLKDGYIRNTNA